MKIVGLNVYPIKGCRGTALKEATLDAQGIRFDRRWMIVRAENGCFLTQREVPALARIVPTASEERLTLAFDSMPPLTIPYFSDLRLRRREVTVWRFTGEALDCGEDAARWLTEALEFPCRLVRTPDDFTRRVNPEYGLPQDRVGFADGYPLLLATQSSLDDLNARLIEQGTEPVPMDRFRPSIVVSGTPAWAEDNWKTLTLASGALSFQVAKPCARCAVTTVDQMTGEKTGPEPLSTLSRFRRDANEKVNFAVNLIHSAYGPQATLRLGDQLEAE